MGITVLFHQIHVIDRKAKFLLWEFVLFPFLLTKFLKKCWTEGGEEESWHHNTFSKDLKCVLKIKSSQKGKVEGSKNLDRVVEEGWKPLNTRRLASMAAPLGSPPLLAASASSWLRKLSSLPVIRRLSTLNFWIKVCAKGGRKKIEREGERS